MQGIIILRSKPPYVAFVFSAMLLAPSVLRADESAISHKIAAQTPQYGHGVVLLPHPPEQALMLPKNKEPCTEDIESAIRYNSAEHIPETCTNVGWRQWGDAR